MCYTFMLYPPALILYSTPSVKPTTETNGDGVMKPTRWIPQGFSWCRDVKDLELYLNCLLSQKSVKCPQTSPITLNAAGPFIYYRIDAVFIVFLSLLVNCVIALQLLYYWKSNSVDIYLRYIFWFVWQMHPNMVVAKFLKE